MKIAKDVVVTMAYKLTLDDGDVVEEATDQDPMTYLHGHNNLVPGLEHGIEGMSKGESRSVTVQPGEAYGDYTDDNVLDIPRADLPADIPYEQGLMLNVVDEDDEHSIATVVEVSGDTITMDFNHPLAGETLTFDVSVIDLREAEPEEIAHGHVHDGHHHH